MLYKSHRGPQRPLHFAQRFTHLNGNFGFAEAPEDGNSKASRCGFGN